MIHIPGTEPGTDNGTDSGRNGIDGSAASIDESVAGILDAVTFGHFVQFNARGSAVAQHGPGGVSALLAHGEVVPGHQLTDSAR